MSDIQTITDALFEPGDIVELRFIKGKAPNAQIRKQWAFAEDLPGMADKLNTLNRQDWNIYFGPNPRKERGVSGDNNVLMARCLFCDFDHIEAGDGCGLFEFVNSENFLRGLPEPTLAVNSGHGIHTYWRLTEPMTDMAAWKNMQERLNASLEADKTIKNPERIMRMPGFQNVKREPFVDCFICWGPNYANL